MRCIGAIRIVSLFVLLIISGCGGGGGGSTSTTTITASMNTVITQPTAVSTVTITGVSTPIIYGLDLKITYPNGVTFVDAIKSGVTPSTSTIIPGTASSTEINVSLAGSDGFGAGEIMKINFNNVQSSNTPADFKVTLLAVYGAGGVQIQ